MGWFMVAMTSVTVFGAASAGVFPAFVDLDIVRVGTQLRLFALSNGGDRLCVYGLDGALLSSTPLPGGIGYLTTPQLEVLGSATSMLALPFGLTNTGSAVLQITGNGTLGSRITYANGTAPPPDLREVASLQTDSGTLIFGADDGSGRINTYRLDTGGLVSQIGETALAGAANAPITAMVASETPAGAILVTATDGGLFVHAIGANGTLTTIRALPDLVGLGLAHISALATVTVPGGATFVLAGGAGSSSVAVFELSSDGLVPVDHIIDSRTTRFSNISIIETIEVNGRVYVVLAGADDGMSLFCLMPDGQLVHLATWEDTSAWTLDSGGAIALAASGTTLFIYVSGGDGEGITRLGIELGAAGTQTTGGAGAIGGTTGGDILIAGTGTTALDGGAGDDILSSNGQAIRLTGGAGRDIFLLAPVAGTIRISDYDPVTDRLDLTRFPMLRSQSQMQIMSTDSGAIITIGSTIIEVTSATGTPIPASAFTDAALLPFDRLGDLRIGVPVQGTEADDLLNLGPTPGMTSGGAGNDTISGSPGEDTLDGGIGNDSLLGNDGNDQIRGGGGNDLLFGGNGNDTLDGGDGDDRLHGGRDHDRLTGSAGADLLDGDNGNDTLEGGTGNDTLHGDTGNDRLFGGDGFDTVYGGSGNDSLDGGWNADFMHGDDGNDTLIGGQGFDVLSGNAGNDLLDGGSDEDWVFGGWDNDTIHGGSGDDFLFGGIGFDTIHGGPGDDQIRGEDHADFLHGDDGADTIFGERGFDVVSGNAGNDVLYGGTEEDWIFGGWDDDRIDAGDGNDFVYCGIGNDLGYGAAGNDFLNGEPGDDQLFGGAGNDTLSAGAGNDILHGGIGADRFIFSGGGSDRILDFNPRETGEVIVLSSHALAGGWASLVNDRMIDTAEGVLIDLGYGNTLLLVGLSCAQLSSNDFIF